MSIVLDPHEPAINRGIKTVGVGKKGSKALPGDLALEIVADLKAGKVTPAAKGAFLAGLLAKGLEPQELILAQAFEPGVFEDPAKLIAAIAPDAPDFIRWVCVQLLNGQTLDKQTAYDLGRFLFSDQPGDGARGIVASFLRVRYETDDEYEGLIQAIHETIDPAFTASVPAGQPIVQLAEPFDGVDHSYMITPLVGKYIQSLGYRSVHMVGKNSGPKWEMNLWDIANALGQKPLRSAKDLSQPSCDMGWFCYENAMSPAIDRWNGIRKQTIKRPFMSTIERFLNPFKSDIVIASAFHPPYGEKMLTIAERAGFKAAIIVRNGIEGTIAFPLLRPVKMLMSIKQKDGSFKRHEMTLDQVGGVDIEQMVEKPKAQDNAALITRYLNEGTSGNIHMDLRVKATCDGLNQALGWIKENSHDLG
jgi:anthranilate phosphoribosyltransferase